MAQAQLLSWTSRTLGCPAADPYLRVGPLAAALARPCTEDRADTTKVDSAIPVPHTACAYKHQQGHGTVQIA